MMIDQLSKYSQKHLAKQKDRELDGLTSWKKMQEIVGIVKYALYI